MSDIVYCKDCAYAEPNNLDAYHAVKLGVFCTRYNQNTSGIYGCDNGKPKTKTNADRIRNMTDEELADWLWKNDWAYLITKMQMLDWLKQEAEA